MSLFLCLSTVSQEDQGSAQQVHHSSLLLLDLTEPGTPVRDNGYHNSSYYASLLTQALCFKLCVRSHNKGGLTHHFTPFLHKINQPSAAYSSQRHYHRETLNMIWSTPALLHVFRINYQRKSTTCHSETFDFRLNIPVLAVCALHMTHSEGSK